MTLFQRTLAFLYGKTRDCYYQRRYNIYRKIYNINSTFGFNGTGIEFYGTGKIELKSNMGSNSTIPIGSNTVIGLNSVVTKNLEANAIYDGMSAKLIRYKS